MRVARRTVLGAGLGVGAMAWPGFAGAQSAAPRFGLVVGNTAYNRGVGELRNAGADADLVAQSLRACGFSVPNDAVVKNVARLPLMAAVRAHVARVQAAGPQAVGFLYYAGHGAAASTGRNYLIPIVSAEEMTDALWDECVDLPWLFETLGASPHAHIVALDACRNSLRTPDRSPGNATYRNVVAEGREHNTFISYSTWEGQTASDGPGGANGPYALALAAHMGVGGQSVVEMFDSVRDEVRARTENVQEPMNLSRLNSASRAMRIVRMEEQAPAVSPVVAAGTPDDLRLLVMSCDYADGPLPALRHTVEDARRVRTALQRSGYWDVANVARDNAPRAAMMVSIRQLAQTLSQTDGRGVGIVYFAGYGASNNGRNYILPADAAVRTASDLETQALSLDWILNTLIESRARASIVILDCGRRFSEAVTPRGMQPGFNEVYARGSALVAFSAAPGQLAVDTAEGSAYAIAFSEEIVQTERRSLDQVLNAVSLRVMRMTDARQLPWRVSTLGAPIYFRDSVRVD